MTTGSSIEPTPQRNGRGTRCRSASKNTQTPARVCAPPIASSALCSPQSPSEMRASKKEIPRTVKKMCQGKRTGSGLGFRARRAGHWQRHLSRPGDFSRINGVLARHANTARGGKQLAARRTLKRLAGEFRNGSRTIDSLGFRVGRANLIARLLAVESLCPLARCFHPSLFLVPALVLLPV